MKKETITTNKVPSVVAPYSMGIRIGELVFTSGQLGMSPSTGKLVDGGIQEETRQTLQNLAAVLDEAGSSLDKVVKTTVFLKRMDDYKEMNKIYGEFFKKDPPARSTVEVAGLALGALVEIDAVAIV